MWHSVWGSEQDLCSKTSEPRHTVNRPKPPPSAEVTARTLMVLNLLFCVLELKKHWRSAISLAQLIKYTLNSLHFIFLSEILRLTDFFSHGDVKDTWLEGKQVDLCERHHTQGPLCHV